MEEIKEKVSQKKKLSEKNILSISISLLFISLCIVTVMNIYISYKKKVLTQKQVEQSVLTTSENKDQEEQLVTAYMLSVGNETFTLRSKEQVVQLLDKIKSDYDQEDEFTILLKEDDEKVGNYEAVIDRPRANQQSLAVVSVKKTPGETAKETEKEDYDQRSMEFEKGVMIKEVEVATKEITDFNDALEKVKCGQVDHQLYQVQEGDCLTDIAHKNEVSVEEILAENP
ncbi:MAG TPA: LysM peptidoglycan-binding domain-containing protein, partial [Candidatus Merdenecus merdavium]|nr:LysM peptidoglycan-binding domain-containing protein [Candidatus Merdenecus merdavium]